MANTTIWFGRLLMILGIVGYGYGLMQGNASKTALIPAAFGVAFEIIGYFAKRFEHLRKHLMHVAVTIGLIGFLIPLWRIISMFGSGSVSFGFGLFSLVAMSLICLLFVILCIKSFIDARRAGVV